MVHTRGENIVQYVSLSGQSKGKHVMEYRENDLILHVAFCPLGNPIKWSTKQHIVSVKPRDSDSATIMNQPRMRGKLYIISVTCTIAKPTLVL